MEREASAILQWSWWRRKHQARAQAAHYLRREIQAEGRPQQSKQQAAEVEQQQEQQRNDAEVEAVWERLVTLLPNEKRRGRPFEHDRRILLEAIVHVMQTGCGWRGLPDEFPPWQTVYTQLTQWRATGVWEIIWAGLAQPRPIPQLQL